MAGTELPLLEDQSVILDSEGRGQVRIGQQNPGVKWFITSLSVSTSTNNKIPRARVYMGDAARGMFIGGTENGSRDTMGPDQVLFPSQYLTVAWEGGDANAIATATVTGTRTVGGWR